MVTRRAAKSKGSQLEMDACYNLKKEYLDLIRVGAEGFKYQFDLFSESNKVFFECKRMAGFNWNELLKYYKKLEKAADKYSDEEYIPQCYLIFQGNNQPVLVFYKNDGRYCVELYNDLWNTFEKRPKKTRVKKDETTRTIDN